MHAKLARASLVKPRPAKVAATLLVELAETREALRINTVKDRTLIRMRQAVSTLIEYVGRDRRLDSIKAGDFDQWRAWMLGERTKRLSESTVGTRISDIKDLFDFAGRKGLVTGKNPLAHLPSSRSMVNDERRFYIDEPTARKVMDALQGAGSVPTWELRLLFALARWGVARSASLRR